MSRQDLADVIAEDTEASKAATTRFFDSLIIIVQNEVAKGGAVELISFGTFEKTAVAARTGRNSKADALIKTPSTHGPKFMPGTAFKDLVKDWAMSKHPDSNGTVLALLRVFDCSEVRGIRVPPERATGRPLCGAVDLAVMREYLDETRHLIDRGYLSRKPTGTSVRLSLTRKDRRAPHLGTPFWPTPVIWASRAPTFAAGVTGCTPMPPEQSRVLLMDAPVLTGLTQTRNPQADTDYPVPCNPYAAPTPKTPMLGNTDAAPEATGKAAARPQSSALARLDAYTVATSAAPTGTDVIPADSAQLTDDVHPVTVITVGPATAAPVAATTPSSLRSLLFSSSVANLNDETKRSLSGLLSLAMTAERVLTRDRTGPTGTVAGNRALAIARVATMRAVLACGGASPRKLKVSYCVTCFVASSDTEAGRSADRRVEVELVTPMPAIVFSE